MRPFNQRLDLLGIRRDIVQRRAHFSFRPLTRLCDGLHISSFLPNKVGDEPDGRPSAFDVSHAPEGCASKFEMAELLPTGNFFGIFAKQSARSAPLAG